MNNDRRSRRTRQAISDALLELMLEKSYDSITVQDIIDRANVGRSTFYSHYQDKEHLLASQIEEMGYQLEPAAKEGYTLLPSLQIFRHTRENHRLYKALVWGRGIDVVFKALQVHLDIVLEAEFKRKLGQRAAPIPLAIAAHYTTGAFLTLLKWWLDKNTPYSPEEMDAYFRELVIPGLEATLGVSF